MATDGGAARSGELVAAPAALFGALLERVDDLTTLRCALRAVFLLARRRGRPPTVTAAELAADPVLALAGGLAAAEGALAAAASHGVLLRAGEGYCLATPAHRRALAGAGGNAVASAPAAMGDAAAPVEDGGAAGRRPDVFRLYEANIGVITPMAAERLRDLEEEYPLPWIAEAFRQAVVSNARSLRYVEAVLRRWRDDGRGDGAVGGRAGTVRASEIVRRPGR